MEAERAAAISSAMEEQVQQMVGVLSSMRESFNSSFSSVEPLVLMAGSVAATLALISAYDMLKSLMRAVEDHGVTGAAAALTTRTLRRVPFLKDIIEKETAKVVDKMKTDMKSVSLAFKELPAVGLGRTALERMQDAKSLDKKWEGVVSGTVYMGGPGYAAHLKLVNEAYAMFAHTNPLHPDVFPSVPRFEAEVVAMTAAMLGGNSEQAGGQVCGNVTSGGTESILMALKSARDFMRARRGITAPEIIVAESAHSAYDKAAAYFGLRLRRARVGADYRASVANMRAKITRNTILMVASAPGFPHGVIDPVEELGRLALKHGFCLHVDLCLGGFVLPFAERLGYNIPRFDFRVPGVTSLSADVHKYGLGPKGSSVVLFRDHALRRCQFVAVTEWTGGLYVSPTVAGSRPGGLVAGAWAALVSIGEDGFLEITKQIMGAADRVKKGIPKIPGLHVVGKPEMTVVAFASNEFDIFLVNDIMSARGWTLNALQRPASIHICITLQHVETVDRFLEDLAAAVETVRSDPSAKMEGGMAPIYGAACKMPDRGTVKDLLLAYMDST